MFFHTTDAPEKAKQLLAAAAAADPAFSPAPPNGAARYVLVTDETGAALAAGRLAPHEEDGAMLLEDVAVLPPYRNKGAGAYAISALAALAQREAAQIVYANVPLRYVPLFERCGFYRAGVEFRGRQRLARTFALEGCAWLGFPGAGEAVIFRGDFTLPAAPVSVTADVLPCGFFEAYLNGEKLSDDLYAPAWTNYSRQELSCIEFPTEDEFCFRSYYVRLDLTAAARAGENAFALHIADGWYAQWESRNGGNRPYGEKKLCYRITAVLENGETRVFSSGDGGVFRSSYITKSSMYFGETQDLREMQEDLFTQTTDPARYRAVSRLPRPYTLIQRQTCPPDRVLRRVTGAKVIYEFGDRRIYDLGENLAGFALLRFGRGAGVNERITVRYAENLHPDGSLNFHSTGGTNRMSVDEFRCCGGKRGEETPLYPHFLWHAGRYVEVTGYHVFDGFCVAASDVPCTAAFHSADAVLNWYFDAFVRTQTDNMHCCIPSDCPHRERLGYTGDGQLTAPAVMTLFDARGFYDKWLRDIADCQDIRSGHVQYTAPFYGGGGGPGGWGCAMVAVSYAHWQRYGDDRVLRTYYPNMLRYLDYMESKCEGHIVVRAEKGGWCLGDWCTPHNHERGILIPPEYVNTYFYLRSLRQVMEIAAALGKEEDLPALRERETAAAQAFVSAFMDKDNGSFCGGECGADAFALDLSLGDARTLQNLVARYRRLGTFDTGIFGTRLVPKVLFEAGYGDDAVRLLSNRGEVSFYHMMESGATTLWEEWFNEYSSNHPMFGAGTELLFRYILGIRQKAGSVGWREIEIAPVPTPSLPFAEGSVCLGGKRITVRVEHGRLVKSSIVPV